MEVILIWAGIWIAYAVIKNLIGNYSYSKKVEKLQHEINKERRLNAFTCKVNSDIIKSEIQDWDVFDIQVKGIVEGPYDKFKMKFVVQLVDVTGEEMPIFSTLEDFQADDSIMFWHESDTRELPYQATIFNSFSTVIRVPKEFLVFPKSGNRKLKFTVSAVDLNNKIYAQDSTIVTYQNKRKGYLDQEKEREYFEEMVIKTALLVSAADGSMDNSEALVVKEWVRKQINSVSENKQAAKKKQLNTFIADAYDEINASLIDIYEVLDGINNIATKAEIYELLQLCLDVAQADGQADAEELKIVNDIAEYINIDKVEFRKMVEKTLPITMHTSEASDKELLGIAPEMSKEEINTHLRKEYAKWNARVASSDPQIREQAEKMIQLIVEARKKYK